MRHALTVAGLACVVATITGGTVMILFGGRFGLVCGIATGLFFGTGTAAHHSRPR